jgi:hypothetical protein
MKTINKTRIFKFRIGELDYKQLVRQAEVAGLTVSEYLRRLILMDGK